MIKLDDVMGEVGVAVKVVESKGLTIISISYDHRTDKWYVHAYLAYARDGYDEATRIVSKMGKPSSIYITDIDSGKLIKAMWDITDHVLAMSMFRGDTDKIVSVLE